MNMRTITFNELRKIKDSLPSGSMHRIADELGLNVDTVRNFFGGHNFKEGKSVGIHLEPGPDGGLVMIDDTTVLERALKILDEMGFKYIRMYDPISYAEMTCQVIRDLGLDMKVMLGPDLISEVNNPGCPWLKETYTDAELVNRAKRNDNNIEKLIEIANNYSDVINAVSVGNENTPKWGANNVPVYSNKRITNILIVIMLRTGIIPASKAPPCIAVNNIVVKNPEIIAL